MIEASVQKSSIRCEDLKKSMNMRIVACFIWMVSGWSSADESIDYRVLECPMSIVGKKLIGQIDPPQEGELWSDLCEWNIILVAPGAMRGEVIYQVRNRIPKSGEKLSRRPPFVLHAWVVISKDLVGIVHTECRDPDLPVVLRLFEKKPREWVEKVRVELTADSGRTPEKMERFELQYQQLEKKIKVTSHDYLGGLKFIKKIDLKGVVEEVG